LRRIELTLSTGPDGSGRIAMTAFLPHPSIARNSVIFASPGGGYARGYYDLRFDGHADYSQAEHHVARGHVVVAYDHLGCGHSSTDRLDTLTIEDIAAHNHDAVSAVADRIRGGTLAEGFPAIPRAAMIGIGQSMGGGVSIIMQARHGSFDAVGVLGYSAIHTVLPQPNERAFERAADAYRFDRGTPGSALSVEAVSAEVMDFVYPFHWEDVPDDIVEADMAGGFPIRRTVPWFASGTIPNCVVAMMGPGYVREEAAAIDVPVFLAFGERDVSRDPRAEPAAFAAASDITLSIVPRMAHMHNFASTRRLLWDRLSGWADAVARTGAGDQ